jgi:hypothetical protein
MYSQNDFIDSYLKKIEEKRNTPVGDAVYNGTNTKYLSKFYSQLTYEPF